MQNFIRRAGRALRDRLAFKTMNMHAKMDLFKGLSRDPQRLAEDLAKPAGPLLYVIYFTPRSGSTWLNDTLRQAKGLGFPREWFNPSFVSQNARHLNADNIETYIAVLRRRPHSAAGFSVQVTANQIRHVFGTSDAFLGHFPSDLPAFYLRREDMVLQAISLAKAVGSNVFHSTLATDVDRIKAEATFAYNGPEFAHWLRHIFALERAQEEMFARHALAPVRLSYEAITAAGPGPVVQLFRDRLGQKPRRTEDVAPRHEKIGTDRNLAFAERLRAENPALIDEIDAFRASLPPHDWRG